MRRLVLSRDEDGLAGDAVHVDACAGLEVVEVDKAVLGDEVDDAVLLRNLNGDGEVVRGLRLKTVSDAMFSVDNHCDH